MSRNAPRSLRRARRLATPLRRPTVERLEDRTQPSVYQFVASADGYAYDRNLDGVFEGSNSTEQYVHTSLTTATSYGEERGIAEFGIANVPTTETITSARLVGSNGQMSYLQGTGITVDVYAYT